MLPALDAKAERLGYTVRRLSASRPRVPGGTVSADLLDGLTGPCIACRVPH
jgi:hypothetical protein